MSLLILMKFFSALFDTSPGLNRSKFLFRDYPKKKINHVLYYIPGYAFRITHVFQSPGNRWGVGGGVPEVLKHFLPLPNFKKF